LKSKDISIKSKINLLFEPFKKSVENDESLEEFITRRFGKEIFLKIGQPKKNMPCPIILKLFIFLNFVHPP
jgi:hypothetical protein